MGSYWVLWGPKCGVKLAAFRVLLTVPQLCGHPFGALGAFTVYAFALRACVWPDCSVSCWQLSRG